MSRRIPALALLAPVLLSAAVCLAAPVQAATVVTLGVYLWTTPDAAPVRAQYISVTHGLADIELSGPDGVTSSDRPLSADERALLETAIKDRVAHISTVAVPQPPLPYVTVEWHFTNKGSYAEGSDTYAVAEVPKAIRAFQKAVFGSDFSKIGAPASN